MSQKRLCLSFKESKSHALHSKLRKQRNTSGHILHYCYRTHCRGDLPFLPFLTNFAFCLNHAYYFFFMVFAFTFCASKKSYPFGFLCIFGFFLLPFVPAKKVTPFWVFAYFAYFELSWFNSIWKLAYTCITIKCFFNLIACYIKVRLIKWQTNFIASVWILYTQVKFSINMNAYLTFFSDIFNLPSIP